jgi:hypothetical protein
MKQYCRYCGFCCEIDTGYYCSDKQQELSENQIKQANKCKNYGYTDVGDVINGGQYKPRMLPPLQKGEDVQDIYNQINMFENYITNKENEK